MSKPLCHMTLASDYRGGERQAEILLRELGERAEVLPDRCSIAVVGEVRDADFNGLELLRGAGFEPSAVDSQAGAAGQSFLLPPEDFAGALRALHDGLFPLRAPHVVARPRSPRRG